METDLADLSCCSLSCRSIDGDLPVPQTTSDQLQILEKLVSTSSQEIPGPEPNAWVAAREGERDLVGSTKGEGASASPSFLFFYGLAARNPRVSCSWGMENGWREREKRERDLGEMVLVFLGLIKPIQVHVYINTGSSDPNPKLP